jgi:acyl carrier protein
MQTAIARVICCVNQVFENKGQTPPSLGPETVLDRTIGLASIDFAELVVRLEGKFGVDPFSEGASLDVVTIQELASLYFKAQHR